MLEAQTADLHGEAHQHSRLALVSGGRGGHRKLLSRVVILPLSCPLGRSFGGGGGRGLIGVEGEEVGECIGKRLVVGQEEWDGAVAARVEKRPSGRETDGVGRECAGRKAGSPGVCRALPQSGLRAGSHPRRWW